MATIKAVDPSEWGTADYVTEVTVTRKVERYGFAAYLIGHGEGAPIFLCALAWKGHQPRHVIARYSEGYKDWRALLDAAPAMDGPLRYVGAASAPRNPGSQWRTHGPSDLLGRD